MGRWANFDQSLIPTVEKSVILSIGWLSKLGLLKDEQISKSVFWESCHGIKIFEMNIMAGKDTDSSFVRLLYSKNNEKYDYIIRILFTPAGFGGERGWLLCPGRLFEKQCTRKAMKLFLPYSVSTNAFLCRKCHNLRAQDQLLDKRLRILMKDPKMIELYLKSSNPINQLLALRAQSKLLERNQ